MVVHVSDHILAEGSIGTAETARRLGAGKRNRPVHPGTVSRWCHKGVMLPDGTRVKLEHVVLPGGRVVTSWPAVLRFLANLQTPSEPGALPLRSAAMRHRAAVKAGDTLAGDGC
jgi:hypothetical protein